MVRLVLRLLALAVLVAGRPAGAACTPVTPVACPKCFAVFVMPDTQLYTAAGKQPEGANHLDLVTRYICENRTSWKEPTTGKTMPILMVIHLGDMVQRGDRQEVAGGPLAEWERIDAAFDNLDACTPRVPYLVTNGNHDLHGQSYELPSVGYGSYFGPDRWASQGAACPASGDCDWSAGQYFLGAGEAIAPLSRNFVDDDGGGIGPAAEQVGRHRAARIVAPNGQHFLFLGLEMAFDFPPVATGFEGVEGDDAAWPRQILEAHPQTATVVFHHSMLWAFDPGDDRLRWGPEIWRSESLSDPGPGAFEDPDFGTQGAMRDLFALLVGPYPQVRFLFTGHVVQPRHQADYTISRKNGPPVWAFLRNYQAVTLWPASQQYGVGWNAVAVFDPEAGQVRVRSYRIDDEEAYADPAINYDHAGEPVATECMDMDENGVGERVIEWDFTVAAATPGLSAGGVGAVAALVVAVAAWTTRRRRAP